MVVISHMVYLKQRDSRQFISLFEMERNILDQAAKQ